MILKLAKRYGLCGFIRLVRDVLLTRVFYRNCRIIRFPCYIRNDGSINFGENFTSGVGLRLDAFGRGVIIFPIMCKLTTMFISPQLRALR